MENILEELAIKYGTDKQIKNGHGYTQLYNDLFKDIRLNELNFFELGVREGWSINMWAEYFPNSKIWCIDNDFEKLCPEKFENDRINFTICDQDDSNKLSEIHNFSGDFDIIIDDCSHISHLTIKSFEILFHFLKKDGMYVIEDLHTCDFKNYTPHDPTTLEYFRASNYNVEYFGKVCVVRK